MLLSLYVIAVIRAAVEGKDHGTYFGSTMALARWRQEAWLAGFLDGAEHDSGPTAKALELYEHLNLASLPEDERAYLWRGARDLERRAGAWVTEHAS